MKLLNRFPIGLMSLALLSAARAQPAEPMPHVLQSGLHENHEPTFTVVSVGTVTAPGAPWLRVHVGRAELGEDSTVVFRSALDGSTLRHNARTLAEWGGWSAFFNGDAVEVDLHVAPHAQGVFVEVDQLLVGITETAAHADDPQREGDIGSDICGDDDRVASSARRIGRFINGNVNNTDAKCTGWICANGAILTAGHCDPIIDPNYAILEFDIPSSGCDGTINFGDADHQYAVDLSSLNTHNNGLGDDYTVLAVFPNPNTGLMPAYGEDAFARVARDVDIMGTDTVRVAGCGIDSTPAGCTGGSNSAHRTRQTHSGDFEGEDSNSNGTWLDYDVDTESGNSGSPILDVDWNLALGIHTNGGCPNSGTSFNHSSLQTAVNDFPGAGTVYVDLGHPIGITDGTLFRPWWTLEFGIADVPGGGILSVVEGQYTYVFDEGVISKPVTIVAPVGPVLITR